MGDAPPATATATTARVGDACPVARWLGCQRSSTAAAWMGDAPPATATATTARVGDTCCSATSGRMGRSRSAAAACRVAASAIAAATGARVGGNAGTGATAAATRRVGNTRPAATAAAKRLGRSIRPSRGPAILGSERASRVARLLGEAVIRSSLGRSRQSTTSASPALGTTGPGRRPLGTTGTGTAASAATNASRVARQRRAAVNHTSGRESTCSRALVAGIAGLWSEPI